jgi:hypothetical protein
MNTDKMNENTDNAHTKVLRNKIEVFKKNGALKNSVLLDNSCKLKFEGVKNPAAIIT